MLEIKIEAVIRRPLIRFTISRIRKRPMDSIQITDRQMFTLAPSGVDEAGNPEPLTGQTLTWASSDSTIVSVTPAADSLSADISSVGPLGTAQVTVTSGNITGTLTVEVVPGTLANFSFNPTNLRDRA